MYRFSIFDSTVLYLQKNMETEEDLFHPFLRDPIFIRIGSVFDKYGTSLYYCPTNRM
jgi:hypothetical protein